MQILGLFGLVFVYFLGKIVARVIKIRRLATALDHFPMDPKHWFWGHLHLFPGHNEEGLKFVRDRTLRFPRLCSFWSGNYFRGDLALYHPEPVSTLLKTSEPKQMISGTYKYGRGWLGDGLVFSSGMKWLRNRKLLTNAFHFEALKQYLHVKNSCTEIFLKNLLPFAKKGESVEIFSRNSLLTFDVILRCAFSYDNDVQTKGEDHSYTKAVTKLRELWLKRNHKPWYHYDFIYWFSNESKEFKENADFVHKISESLIKERKKIHELSSERPKKDFLDILMTAKDEDGRGLNDSEIRDEVDTFLFAGHDTTSCAISWTLYSLAENQEEQTKCQKEVDEILGGRLDDVLKWEDLAKLKYLTMCIKEAMRIHSPVPFVGRELENPMTIDGIEIPAGSMVSALIYALHHNPSVWPDSLKFMPSRFSPENTEKMNAFSFIPFSAGPRNCIGQTFAMNEIKVVLARTLKRFSLNLDTERQTRHKPNVVMGTENGMFLKIKERN